MCVCVCVCVKCRGAGGGGVATWTDAHDNLLMCVLTSEEFVGAGEGSVRSSAGLLTATPLHPTPHIHTPHWCRSIAAQHPVALLANCHCGNRMGAAHACCSAPRVCRCAAAAHRWESAVQSTQVVQTDWQPGVASRLSARPNPLEHRIAAAGRAQRRQRGRSRGLRHVGLSAGTVLCCADPLQHWQSASHCMHQHHAPAARRRCKQSHTGRGIAAASTCWSWSSSITTARW